MRQSSESSWAYFVFVCSIAVACAGATAGGERGGGKSGGNHGGGGNSAASQGGGGNSAASHHGEGRKDGAHKGPSGSSSRSPVDDDGTSTTATAAVAATTAATAVSVARSASGRSLDLPSSLQPPGDVDSPATVSPIKALPGVPYEVVRACHDAIESAAAPFGATSVRVSSAGSMRRLTPDTISAPVEVSIDYGRQGNVETRQAPIKCELNATGSVIGLT